MSARPRTRGSLRTVLMVFAFIVTDTGLFVPETLPLHFEKM